jgi:hypothetical protein
MKIYVDGEKPEYLISELNKIVMELNDLIEKYEFFSKFRRKKLTAALVLNALLELKQLRAEAKALVNSFRLENTNDKSNS